MFLLSAAFGLLLWRWIGAGNLGGITAGYSSWIGIGGFVLVMFPGARKALSHAWSQCFGALQDHRNAQGFSVRRTLILASAGAFVARLAGGDLIVVLVFAVAGVLLAVALPAKRATSAARRGHSRWTSVVGSWASGQRSEERAQPRPAPVHCGRYAFAYISESEVCVSDDPQGRRALDDARALSLRMGDRWDVIGEPWDCPVSPGTHRHSNVGAALELGP
jgi:hypothetical protein